MVDFPKCATCMYADCDLRYDEGVPIEGDWWLCRRHAPVVVAKETDGIDGAIGLWPRVHSDDSCGEWRQSPINTGQRRLTTYRVRQLELFDEIKTEQDL